MRTTALLLALAATAATAHAGCPFLIAQHQDGVAGRRQLTAPDPPIVASKAVKPGPEAATPSLPGPVVASQRAVGGLGDAATPVTAAALVDLLGAVSGVPVNGTDYASHFPPSASKEKRLAPAPRQVGWTAPRFSKPSSCSSAQYNDIVKALNTSALNFPGLVRLAFHTCGSYSALDAAGGCDGAWLRYAPDADAPSNGGSVKTSVEALKRIKDAHPCITYADLYTLAGSVGVELAGGPPVAWSPGRVDAEGPGPAHPPYASRLPEGMFNGAGLAYLMNQWGFSPREAVAIIGGGHSVGGATPDASGWNLTFTPAGDAWPTPGNQYFDLLMNGEWLPAETEATGLPYYKLAPGHPSAAARVNGKPVGRFPSDMALRVMKLYAPVAAEYARDKDAFLSDFSFAYEKLLALGSPGVGRQGGGWRWNGLKGDWDGHGPDAAFMTLEAHEV